MNIKMTANSHQGVKKIITLFGTVLALLLFGNATYEIKELIVPAKSFLESFFQRLNDIHPL